jgi:prepilin-type N-terminal cleavage/methylation domain-containing protein
MTAAKSIARRGFSLIELVIVIVIIGIIAAIAIPRMSRGSTGASESSLRASLAVMRNAIELYTTEHEGEPPTVAGIVDQLTQYSDIAGATQATPDNDYIFGPYIREIPKLPVKGDPDRRGKSGIAAADAGTIGWLYTVDANKAWSFKANTGSQKDSRGASFSDY